MSNGDQKTALPRTTVVVASHGERARLHSFLAEVLRQAARWDVELVVARSDEAASLAGLAAQYPGARFIACPAQSSEAELRAAGMREATGDIVALMADDAIVATDWLQQLVGTYQRTGI